MIVLQNTAEDGVLTVELRIEPDEFAEALHQAYLDHTDRFPVPGFAPGLAPRDQIEQLYGETALFDEALDISVPRLYRKFLDEQGLRTIGRPALTEVTWMEGGGARFTVVSDLYPHVVLGDYRNVAVPVSRSDEAAFEAAALTAACATMEADVPAGMVEQKLDAMLAAEKMRFGGDAIYQVLADCIAIVEAAYHEADISRPKSQVRAEALDLMLQTMSGDNKEISSEQFHALVRELVERYRPTFGNFDADLDEIIDARKRKKAAMTPDERINEAFDAYLGSLEMNEKAWRDSHREQAADAARFDVLLTAVAQAEAMAIDDRELFEAYQQIADQCGLDVEEVAASIDAAPLKEQLLRDKARAFIVAHATELPR